MYPPEENTHMVGYREEIHSGPLPSPSTLRQYEQLYPGLCKTIVDEFQAEAAHRRLIELTESKYLGRSINYGLVVILAILVCGFGAAVFLAWMGAQSASWLSMVVAIVPVVLQAIGTMTEFIMKNRNKKQ